MIDGFDFRTSFSFVFFALLLFSTTFFLVSLQKMNFPIDYNAKPSSTGYAPATYYAKLAQGVEKKNEQWPSFGKIKYEAHLYGNYKGQDIDMQCPVNQSYFSIPPGTTFLPSPREPSSVSRELYPKTRLPDGQPLYSTQYRAEPVLNGKRFMYDVPFEEMNPVPGMKQIGYRRKVYPLTDMYPREINRFSNVSLPTLDF